MTRLAVAEIFGPTFQGEGPNAGRLCHFLRLGGCNLACSWCDTPYTWDATRFNLRQEIKNLDLEVVRDDLAFAKHVVITGGEPLLQADAIWELLNPFEQTYEIETNGTIAPPHWHRWVDQWNVSPKLSNSGRRSVLHNDWYSTPNVAFKFVVKEVADFDEVASFGTPDHQTWIMPEGTTASDVLTTGWDIADDVAERGWNLTLRMQTLLWGAERGR